MIPAIGVTMKERLQIGNEDQMLIDVSTSDLKQTFETSLPRLLQTQHAKLTVPALPTLLTKCDRRACIDDKFHEECGVAAIYGHPEASKLAYLSLYALQHRGQESAGISTSDGTLIHTKKSMGHVADIFTNECH